VPERSTQKGRRAGAAHRPLLAEFLSVSPDRKRSVLDEIRNGSEPRAVYYVLLTVSAGIAAFGLLASSAAVVIGAMLVSPLMTPIFGIALGLSRGDFALLRRALVAEFGGVAFILIFSMVLGLLPFALEVTPEMLARTKPTLIDLVVATLAGLAGGLAMVDERTSPALPGVAIATSLTPPLAVSGLSLAFGSYAGAWGAFLLFFANFLAILAVSAVIFNLAGFVTRAEFGSGRELLRRFAATAIGLLAVGALLTRQLVVMIDEFQTRTALTSTLEELLEGEPGASLANLVYQTTPGSTLDVLAIVRTPRPLSPQDVKAFQSRLGEAVGRQVSLFVRCTLTQDVAAAGSLELLPSVDLDGHFVKVEPSADARLVQTAEQLLLELVELGSRYELIGVELLQLPSGPVVVASIEGAAALGPGQVRFAEERLRKRLGRDDVSLVVRTVSTTDLTSKGRILLGGAHFEALDAEGRKRIDALEAEARRALEALRETVVVALDVVEADDQWTIRAQVAATQPPQPQVVARIEAALARSAGRAVSLSVWWTSDLIVTRDGLTSLEASSDALADRQRAAVEMRLGAAEDEATRAPASGGGGSELGAKRVDAEPAELP